ncbi:uncharacterized protein LOC129765916 isoform X2 [Toxorhynchites rutilus septentrionalis]|nr:uncharacterized protein LOC129765916 isoform X2 [Toxorhynchites rutilus septentrionalis]XP_055622352.1 uncharacterized protein LOC129765916 isoform X2 [Toxorhynchites rutilus septentrionalis]XP_055622358.1 uncharacterized protein LOC129765916 isoform X2 [Toxorhynchites rutilus septentrionalis]XP_055622365.1 uncharacterized protein LOC129765916 isoform X2 [Toxorhynchites rutilus septentrionalis]XP_055622372.1 uncharacterized protein LOC129765916 isoform X2 [Toxorhynchites rutilus septentriona
MSNAQDISRLTSKRTSITTALGRVEAFLQTFNAETDQPQLELRIAHLDGLWVKMEDVLDQLEGFEESEEGMAVHDAIRSDFESRFFKIKSLLLSKLSSLAGNFPTSTHNANTNSTLSGIKLPTISLPEFDGDYMRWLAFHDTFLALIHSNPDVADIQKFHYLRAAIKGEAAQLIESIPISSANYNLAWQTLTSRYSNEYLLKKRHLQALFDIQRIKKESAVSLHSLVDEFERHIKVLRQLNEPTDTWSTILEHLLCTRLPEEALQAWEENASRVDDPNYACLIEFLQRRIRVLESMSVNNHNSSANSFSSNQHLKKQPPFRFSSCASTATPTDKCPACNQLHLLMKCQKFNRFSHTERQQFVSSKRLRNNCLRKDHIARNCPSSFNCKVCNRRHHTLLHASTAESTKKASNSADSSASQSYVAPISQPSTSHAADSQQTSVTATEIMPVVNCTPVHQSNENVFLLTAVIKIVDAYGQEHLARALLDSASQPNLISQRMAQILKLIRNKVNILIQGAGKLSKPVTEAVFTEIKSRKEDFSQSVNFLVMDKPTANLPAHNVSIGHWKIPADLFLADPHFNKSQPIDIVLGVKHFYSFFPDSTRIHIDRQHPVLVNSVFGWIIAGATSFNTNPNIVQPQNVIAITMISLEESLERFWSIEHLSVKDNLSIEERKCEDYYKKTILRKVDGRYIVRYPKQNDFDIMLGTSKPSALRRFELLEKRLERDPQLKAEYHNFMREYLALGHMRLVKTDTTTSKTFYLPHHPVFKEASTTTKMRVVFDGSARTSTNFSLNNALCVGPVVQDDLLTIILRFRTYQIALVGDIAKMYRQVLVHPDDVPLQRVIWRFSNDVPAQTYELLTVTYGLAPSAYLATRTLNQLAEDEGHNYPLGARALKENFYVDDFIGGAQTTDEALRLREELSQLLRKGGFSLRKWSTNQLQVLHGLNDDET